MVGGGSCGRFDAQIAEYCRSSTEQEIVSHCFDLVMAFDELMSLGHRERLSLPQLKTILSMDSASEREWEHKQQVRPPSPIHTRHFC